MGKEYTIKLGESKDSALRDDSSRPHALTGSRWVVKNRDNDEIMRGPYDHSETASAVRSEMERQDIYDNLNLWISPFENG